MIAVIVCCSNQAMSTIQGACTNLWSNGSAVDLPDGRFVDSGVESPLQKYFASPVGQIISTSSRHPTPPEGRIAIVTDAGCGCGGRGSVLRAMGSQGESKDS
jgi:hypothetical protein